MIFDDELFIIGRIKDLLIVYGRNHSPDDIEATIQEITRGRCAAIAVPDGHTEKLVVIIEVKKRGESHEEAADSSPSLSVKSPRRSPTRTVLALRIWFWCLLVRYRSPQAARSGERRVSSSTGTVSSPGWTLSLNPWMGDFAWSSTWLP